MESWMGSGAFAVRYARPPPDHPPVATFSGNRRSAAHRHAGTNPGATPRVRRRLWGRRAARGWSAQALGQALTAGG